MNKRMSRPWAFMSRREKEPTKYWLSTLPEDATLLTLVDMAKLRRRIERDYEELKSELGLSHFEGRGWRGFHHHVNRHGVTTPIGEGSRT